MTEPFHIPGYRIERMIARGGMAEVYLAEQLSLGRKVAIKVMDGNTGGHEFAERFLHEARLVATLNHSNLITIYDFGTLATGNLFLSMEYLQGGDLEERMARGITEKTALRVLHDLASVLGFVHRNGIIHRDIKPANILFRQDETLVLTDFGIAKQINNDVSLTQAGMIVGSAAYGSPEQMQGLELNQRSDIYSLGVLFLEMLLGKNPFKTDTFVNTAMNHMQMDIPKLTGDQARFQPLLAKMLAKKPQDRFASMDDVLEKFDTIALGTTPAPVTTGQAKTVLTNITGKISIPPLPVTPLATADAEPDDFATEALQLLAETDRSLTAKTPKVTPPANRYNPGNSFPKPAAGNSRNKSYVNVRTRPLPSNLLDDD